MEEMFSRGDVLSVKANLNATLIALCNNRRESHLSAVGKNQRIKIRRQRLAVKAEMD
ncbi:MAG: hypothetical protein QM710_14045 [Flavobacterium sp.]